MTPFFSFKMINNYMNNQRILIDLIYHQPTSITNRARWELIHETMIGDVIIPKGFVTDGASIPKMFLLFTTPTSKAFPAAIVHDYMLSKIDMNNYYTTRSFADEVFYKTLSETNVSTINANLLYYSVSLFTIIKSSWVELKKLFSTKK